MPTTDAAWMPPPRTAALNGLEMTYHEVGPRGVGAPVIFCHGFPETAFSWRHQLKAFEAVGRWAVAPDQRGYGATRGPANSAAGGDVTQSDMEHLTGDLVGLLDHLGAEKGVFAGHDWGGLVVWRMPLLHPDRVAGVVGVNTPFLPRGPLDPVSLFRRTLGEDNYIVRFQSGHDSDALFAADVERTMRFFMRLPAPDQAAAPTPGERQSFALQKALQRFDKADPRGQFLSPEELAVFVRAFEASGFTGGIDWYRNMRRNWEREEGLAMSVPMPALMVMAEKDAVLPPRLADGMEAYVPDLEKHLVMGSGHWTQQEKPDEVSRVLLDWLDRRFPAP